MLRKGTRLEAYRFMEQHGKEFGIRWLLRRLGICPNAEMRLYSLVHPKKPCYRRGKPHKAFENKLQQKFHADHANHKRCTDFTYLFLKNGEALYNCSITGLLILLAIRVKKCLTTTLSSKKPLKTTHQKNPSWTSDRVCRRGIAMGFRGS